MNAAIAIPDKANSTCAWTAATVPPVREFTTVVRSSIWIWAMASPERTLIAEGVAATIAVAGFLKEFLPQMKWPRVLR